MNYRTAALLCAVVVVVGILLGWLWSEVWLP